MALRQKQFVIKARPTTHQELARTGLSLHFDVAPHSCNNVKIKEKLELLIYVVSCTRACGSTCRRVRKLGVEGCVQAQKEEMESGGS